MPNTRKKIAEQKAEKDFQVRLDKALSLLHGKFVSKTNKMIERYHKKGCQNREALYDASTCLQLVVIETAQVILQAKLTHEAETNDARELRNKLLGLANDAGMDKADIDYIKDTLIGLSVNIKSAIEAWNSRMQEIFSKYSAKRSQAR